MNSTTENANLDVLRSWAVLSVLAFHLVRAFDVQVPLLDGLGRFGVLVFFVHTSIVLLFSLQRQHDREGSEASRALDYASFMTRRIFRIYPASVLLVLFVWVLDLPMRAIEGGRFVGVHLDAPSLLTNILLVQNLTHTESVLAPVWSLPYEVQMYIVLPFLFWAVRRLNIFQVLASWLVVAVVCASMRGYMPAWWDTARFVPCFFAGIVSFRLSQVVRPRLFFGAWPVVIVGTTLLFTAYRMNHEGTSVGWLCCLLLGLGAPFFRELPRTFQAPFALVARYSYGIYLTHYVTIWFAFVRLGWLPLLAQWVVFALLTVGASAFLYHAVERPLVRRGMAIANALERLRLRGRPAPELGPMGRSMPIEYREPLRPRSGST